MATPLEKWIDKIAGLTKPARVYWCDGSEEEARRLIEIGIKEEKIEGFPVFRDLNHKTYPNSYYHRSHPTDVARTEHLTYVCHRDKDTAGPNNNWMDPEEAKALMAKLSSGCMKGRTMYVLPYMMGHPQSPYAKACIQVTDITYVAVSMRIMTRMSRYAIAKIGQKDDFVKGIHSVGDFDPKKRFIMHFPDDSLVWSIGSGYGGNALLGKKCFSLRLASWLGKREGWLAEHMVVIGIEDPRGNTTYVTAALPSACGKTNLAMMESALPGYKIRTLGDDIAWLNVGPNGRLYAINPENGFFGVAPGTSMKTNPNMMRTLKKGTFFPTLFTNTAINEETNEPWWEGLDGERPNKLIDWQGNRFNPGSGNKAAHPNSRFTASISQCPTLSKEFENPMGVPISAMLFGGRRAHTIPLVTEARDWTQGVFIGARMGSETTAAAVHREGILRRDPMAMLPFCGYNMGDYFNHWLSIGRKLTHPPRIFSINWFRTDDKGRFLWPGFGDNIRVFKWIIDRVNNRVGARETPVGHLPRPEDLDLKGLDISKEDVERLFSIDKEEWGKEIADGEQFFAQFGDRMPKELIEELHGLKARLKGRW
ncbi:MAG: phosphoenolpyruvate carboxykinase (GTP) [Candidatus Omnitrophica bacterium]|nr:phosphoenolpyruvate carboxykinase (GTP) [Candidatus Omnitrophota bacterium]